MAISPFFLTLPAKPLAYEYEHAPPKSKILPRFFRPFAGVEYRVQDGDNWENVAARYNMPSAKDLVRYNFLTDHPPHVNWYLRTRVGCRVATADEKNWRFKDAWPGIIFLPADHHYIVIPPPPTTIVYNVTGDFPRIAQMNNDTCWAAAATIIMSWHDETTYSIHEAMEIAGDKWRKRVDTTKGLLTSEYTEFANDCGMHAVPFLGGHASNWLDMLKKKGALLVVLSYKHWAHGVVLTGVQSIGDETYMIVVDPARGGVKRKMTYEEFSADFEAGMADDAVPLVWHYGSPWVPLP